MKLGNILTPTFIQKCSKDFNNNDQYLLARNAVTSSKLDKVVLNNPQVQKMNHVFSNTIKTVPAISDQENSGRCWIFAFLNTIRVPMIKKYELDEDFEFSQTYLFFWHKWEQCYCFLRRILETRQQPTDDELVRFLLTTPQEDGGSWNMFVSLVQKYGLLPKSEMKETYHSRHSHKLDTVLKKRLRDYAYQIRQFPDDIDSDRLRDTLEKYMLELYRVIVIFLGEPPTQFLWERYQKKDTNKRKNKNKNKDKKSKRKNNKDSKKNRRNKSIKKDKKLKSQNSRSSDVKNNSGGGNADVYVREKKRITPLEFYKKCVPVKLENMVALIHYPSEGRKKYTLYDIKYIENVYGGKSTNFISVSQDDMIQCCKKSIDRGSAIWFAGDVNFDMNNKHGIMDPDSYNTRLLFGFESGHLKKGERLQYYDTEPNHAMVINGYNLDSDKINRWKVENSWGDDIGQAGYYTMTSKWFNENVFMVVVDKKCVNKKILGVLNQKPTVLQPWDPFGTSAKI